MTARDARPHLAAAEFGPARFDPHPLKRLWRRLARTLAVMAERRRLAEMDDRTLRDLGLTRAEACREFSRPWWDLPSERFHDPR
jgi:uncharacterized protein YjiS (DUF1127 family)